jgi:hypothetical protein
MPSFSANSPARDQRPTGAPAGSWGAGRGLVGVDGFGQVLDDALNRVERGHRVLEDHPDLAAAHGAHFVFGEGHQVPPVKKQLPAGDAGGDSVQAHQALAERGFTAGGFADQPQDLPAADVKAHRIDGAHVTGAGVILHVEIADGKKIIGCHQRSLNLGLRISISPSPIMVKANTITMMAMPGKVISHQELWI